MARASDATVASLLSQNNNEKGAVLRAISIAKEDIARSGSSAFGSGNLSPEVLSWYNQQTGGKTGEAAASQIWNQEVADGAKTNAMIASGQIKVNLTPQGAVINDYNTPGDIAAQQRLAAMNTAGAPATPIASQTPPGAPQLGTSAYTNYLVDQGKALGMNLEQFRVPTQAGQGAIGSPALSLPGVEMKTGSTAQPTAYMAGVEAQEKAQQANADRATAQKQELNQAQTNQNSLFQTLLKSQPNMQGALSQAQKDAGLNKLQEESAKVRAEYAALNEKYVNLEAKMEEEVTLSQGAMATTGFITRKEAEIRNRYKGELNRLSGLMNGKTAYLAMVRGDIQDANVAVGQMVDAITAESKWKFDTLSTMIQSNDNTISRLDSRYQNTLNQAHDLARQQLDNDTQEAWKKADLIVELAKAGIDASGYANKPLEDLANFAGQNSNILDKGSVVVKSGNLEYTQADMAEDSQALENSRGQEGSPWGKGYVSPVLYLQLYQAWIDGGGLLKDFLTTYPPKNYINPAYNSSQYNILPPALLPPKPSSSFEDAFNDL